ncbi:MAG TPA: dihydrofolate reductase family protein [Allosphingosinicella sp.]|jgi:dihydrofolate reductase
MRKLIGAAFVSLDGVMQAPGGPEEDPSDGFDLGGWVYPFWDDTIEGGMAPLFSGPLDLLLGRRTYDMWAGHWPDRNDDPIGEAYNRAAKYVVTSRTGALSWSNSHALNDGFDGVARIKEQDGPDLQVWGSSTLYRGLIGRGLLDRLFLITFPVILGRGKRLFAGDMPARTLTLVDSQTSKTGVIIATYEPAGPVQTGSFAA